MQKGKRCGIWVLWVLVGALGMLAHPVWGQESVRVDDFQKTYKPNQTFGHWNARKFAPVFGNGDVYFFQFVHEGETHHLHLKSGKDNSFSVGVEEDFEVKDWPVLEWEWRVTQLPAGGDVRIKEKDDQAGAMCVIVNPGLTGFSSLCYLWENDGPKDKPLVSTKKDNARYLILRTGAADGTGKWYSERRNILEDFTRVFGRAPDKKAVLGIQIDSDSVAGQAEAFYRNISRKKK
ncbi:MAG: DUF3047 domain-containing protein [Deltaproteobacteria bacterium]|nr:DUF3047 domain-containing protein [Deltaproteobacteria bacterium]